MNNITTINDKDEIRLWSVISLKDNTLYNIILMSDFNSRELGFKTIDARQIPSTQEHEDIVSPKWDRILDMPSTGWHSFNVTASDMSGNRRNIVDSRHETCKEIKYDISQMPTTSIISIFHNEARSTLMRTIHSFLDRTPPQLLKEFILVDDASTHPWLLQPLTDYVAHFPKIKLIRFHKRSGLVRARLRGAHEATGKVLFFMDSHTEANIQWLEPLLTRIMENRKSLVIPIIDPIEWESLEYYKVKNVLHGAMTWNMVFYYKNLPQHIQDKRTSPIDPITTPVMVGCAHAIEKDYFFETGAYDNDMEIWGGENIEHAFRLWMCGGRVECIPCSRVGHIFKPKLPYQFPDDSYSTIQRNLIRTAEMWMGDYKKYYYAQQDTLPPIDLISLKERKKLKDKLNCHNFDWYMKNISPEMPVPPLSAQYYGEMKSQQKTSECLHFDEGLNRLIAIDCERQSLEFKQLRIDNDGKFIYKNTTIVNSNMFYNMSSSLLLSGLWKVTKHAQIRTTINGKPNCITYIESNPIGQATLSHCDKNNKYQKWTIMYKFNFTKVWDIEQVVKDALTPPKEATYFGQLTNMGTTHCLDIFDNTYYDMIICHQQRSYKRVIHLDKDGTLMFMDKCLQPSISSDLQILKCDHTESVKAQWEYDRTTKLFKVVGSKKCLFYNWRKSIKILFITCDPKDPYQKWILEKVKGT